MPKCGSLLILASDFLLLRILPRGHRICHKHLILALLSIPENCGQRQHTVLKLVRERLDQGVVIVVIPTLDVNGRTHNGRKCVRCTRRVLPGRHG